MVPDHALSVSTKSSSLTWWFQTIFCYVLVSLISHSRHQSFIVLWESGDPFQFNQFCCTSWQAASTGKIDTGYGHKYIILSFSSHVSLSWDGCWFPVNSMDTIARKAWFTSAWRCLVWISAPSGGFRKEFLPSPKSTDVWGLFRKCALEGHMVGQLDYSSFPHTAS